MKVVIPGGSGQVGTMLARAFHEEGHDVVVLSRRPTGSAVAGRCLGWRNPRQLAKRDRRLRCRDQFDRPQRQLPVHRRESRGDPGVARVVDAGRWTGDRDGRARTPRVWLQASTATIYAHRYDGPNDEHSGILGGDEPGAPDSWRFSIDVARAWERAFEEAAVDGTRKVALRSAMTLSPDRWRRVRHAARAGAPRPRRQCRRRPAVHVVDSPRRLRRGGSLADRPRRHRRRRERRGAESRCRTQSSCRSFARRVASRLGLPATKWMLEIGAVFMRTETELILKSRRVVPARLLEHGFTFAFPTWRDAALDLCQRWRARLDAGARAA